MAKSKFYDKKKILMEIGPLAIFLIMLILAIYFYPVLPERIPIHWNAAGQIDNYGSKLVGIFLLPAIYLIFIVFAAILPAMDVYSENIKKFYNYYYAMKILFGIFFLAFFIAILLPNFGYAINMSYWILGLIAILFFVLGYILRHVKRNFFIGIRTPWTLNNEIVWNKTHDLGGKLFMIFAVILAILLFLLPSAVLFIVFIIMIIALVLFLMFYSYNLYKKI